MNAQDISAAKARYRNSLAAIRRGVERAPRNAGIPQAMNVKTTPKELYLRAIEDRLFAATILKLLIKKGLVTLEEFYGELSDLADLEVSVTEMQLTEEIGCDVRLA